MRNISWFFRGHKLRLLSILFFFGAEKLLTKQYLIRHIWRALFSFLSLASQTVDAEDFVMHKHFVYYRALIPVINYLLLSVSLKQHLMLLLVCQISFRYRPLDLGHVLL